MTEDRPIDDLDGEEIISMLNWWYGLSAKDRLHHIERRFTKHGQPRSDRVSDVKMILEDFFFLYDQYYLEDDENLTEGAQKIKYTIARMIEEREGNDD